MNKWVLLIIVAAIAAAIYIASRPDPVIVSVVQVERGPVERTVANTRAGTVKACYRSKLSMQIGGQIDSLNVREGDKVEKDQVLMTLWNEDRKARLNETKKAIDTAALDRKSICINADFDQREANRLKQLVEQNLTSEESADLAESRAKANRVGCEAARAREKQAQAAVLVAEASLEQTILRAPFAGIVAEVTGEVGEFSTPSPPGIPTPPAVDLLTHDCHYISAPIDEVDASDIVTGMPVRVTLDAFRDRNLPGTVRRIAPYILDFEKQARTVEIEVELEPLPEDITLLAGYSADIEIILETQADTIRVPSELVIEDSYVLMLDESGVISKRDISKGLSNWSFTEIASGLQPGDEVISNVGSKDVKVGNAAVIGELDD